MKLRTAWIILLIIAVGVHIAAAQSDFAPGDKVIVTAQKLTVYDTANTSSHPIVDLLHGFVGQVVANKTDSAGKTWIYLSDGARGWVEPGNPSALTAYSDAALAQIVQDAGTTLTSSPNDGVSYLTRASAETSQHNYDAALADLAQAIDLSPQDGSLYFYRANVYAMTAQWDQAIADALRAPTSGYQTAQLYNLTGSIYSHQSQEDVAQSYYEQAIQTDANYGLPYLNLAKSYYTANRIDEALTLVQQALKADPQLAIAYSTQGTIYETLGNTQNALQSYTTAIKLAPFDSHGYIERALFYSAQQDYKDSQKDFDQAVQIDPQSDRAYAGRGINDLSLGDLQRGIQDLKQALTINPNNADALFNLGSAYSLSRQYQEALDQYNQAIQASDHYNTGALLYRAQIYRAMANDDSALDDLNQYLMYAGDYFAVAGYITRAALYTNRSNFTLAQSDLVTAISTQADFTSHYQNLGSGYWADGGGYKRISSVAQKAAASPNDSDLQLQLAQLSIQYGLWKQAHDSLARYATLTNNSNFDLSGLLDTLAQLAG